MEIYPGGVSMEKTYEVKGMTCVICKGNVERALKNTPGVLSCKINLLENEASVSFDETKTNEEIMAKAVKDAGYELVIRKNEQIDLDKIIMFVSAGLVLILMYFSMGHMFGLHVPSYGNYIQLILSTIIILLNFHHYRSGFLALFHLRPNMDSLVSISSSVSYLYSLYVLFSGNPSYHLYFETAAMVPVIVSIGKYIEGKNNKKAAKTIRGLATLIPMQANLLKDGEITVIPIDDLKVNDIVSVRPGESIPQDGVVISGTSTPKRSSI